MEVYSWIIENKETIKIIYAAIIVLICAIITYKSHKLYKLSSYQGIRYFRNAFMFYGIAFIIRYFIGSNLLLLSQNYSPIIGILFSFFFIMAGFFLLYSMLWKKIESPSLVSFYSLFNPRILIFYAMAFILVLLDFFWDNLYLLFCSQILIFLFAFAISFNNYNNNGKNAKFLKLYVLAMFLALIAWILNALAGWMFYLGYKSTIIIYLLNIIMFLLFLFGIIKVTKRS